MTAVTELNLIIISEFDILEKINAGEDMDEGKVFGYQLVLDLYGCKEELCDDLGYCYRFLDEVVAFLKMEKQAPPQVFISDATKYPDKAGISGWVPLIESSVVIHTLTPKKFISIDIYSCREYDPEATTEYVKNFFGCKEIESQFFTRGKNYFKQ